MNVDLNSRVEGSLKRTWTDLLQRPIGLPWDRRE